LRDWALIGLMVYLFARIGDALEPNIYYQTAKETAGF
jgi:hypothetical protein